MSRIPIYISSALNLGSHIPLPVIEFVVPVASDIILELQIFDVGDDKEPFSLSGYDATFTVRKKKYSKDNIVIEKTIEDGMFSETYSDDGYIDIDLSAHELDLTPGQYWYELNLANVDSQIYRNALGKFILLP